jgi:prepilin-type N-terminal cleavage/methylation domain-containing protein
MCEQRPIHPERRPPDRGVGLRRAQTSCGRRTRGSRALGLARGRGFTLLEILIVVVILGILATFVIPQFSNASMTAKENTLKDELRYLRTQIIVYRAQHNDRSPGASGVDTDFIAEMTQYTSELGIPSPTGSSVYKYGPYLSKMPANPINGKDTVEMSTAAVLAGSGDGSHGWIYNPETQEFIADIDGTDLTGVRYDSY